MVFRDQKLACKQCGKAFFFTVTEQRQLADQLGEDAVQSPDLCPQCRAPDEAAAQPKARPSFAPKKQVQASTVAQAEHHQPVELLDEFPLEVEGVKVKLIGKVKWFNPQKGYGFVAMANNQDVFFRRESIVDRTIRLRDGEQVEFQVRQTEKGPEAFNISVLPSA